MNLRYAEEIDHDAYQIATNPNPHSIAYFIPPDVRQAGLKSLVGYKLTPQERELLLSYRKSSDFIHDLVRYAANRRR